MVLNEDGEADGTDVVELAWMIQILIVKKA